MVNPCLAQNHVQVPHPLLYFGSGFELYIVQCYQFYPYITLNYTTSEHCQMEPWSAWEWSNGAKSCGTGTRTRYAKIAALHGGDSCEKRFGKDFGKETKEIPCVGELKKI